MRPSPSPPKPWIVANPRAFLLGCDPTAFFTDPAGNKIPILFKNVFDLGEGGDFRYFAAIHYNLLELELDYISDVYVQNLVTDYQPAETSKNKDWNRTALESIQERKEEFDDVDPTGKIPTFLTSERLYKVLMNPGEKLLSASELYQSKDVVIPAEKNQLGRPLIALYRHPGYKHDKQAEYYKRVKNNLNFI